MLQVSFGDEINVYFFGFFFYFYKKDEKKAYFFIYVDTAYNVIKRNINNLNMK